MFEPSKDPTKKGPGSARTWSLLVALVLAVLLAAAAAVYLAGMFGAGASQDARESGSPSSVGQARQPDAEPEGQAGEDAPREVPTRGNEDAPVTMVEYADFQCPFCGKFAREVEPELIERYVESGRLKIEWRDFPYLGQESANAALAARAAHEQDKFWEYHDALYRDQVSLNSGAFSDENLVAFAEEAGLDVEQFESDLTSGKYERAVSQDLQEGQRLGISGTPTFFINDRMLVGAQPIEAFEEAIEEASQEGAGNG